MAGGEGPLGLGMRAGRRHRVVLLGVAGVVGAFVLWDRVIEPQVIPKRFGVVTPGTIYRSGKLTPATMGAVVRDHEIKTIVDLGAWVHDPRGERLEAQTAQTLGVERHVFDLLGDSTGDPNDYVEALRLMTDPASQPVLVHCGAGTERTGVVVYLYRTIVEGVDKDEALAEARRAGHDPRRNPRLKQTLERWEAQIAQAYRDGSRIELGAGGSDAAGPGTGGRAPEAPGDGAAVPVGEP